MATRATNLTEWRASLASTRARATTLVEPLSAADREKAPAHGAWSVDQILEHLATTNTLYAASMKGALASYDRSVAPPPSDWKPTWIGRMLRNAVDPQSQRKLPAPQRVVPGPTVHSGVLERFVGSVDELSALLDASEGLDLRRVRFRSPLLRFLRLNLGDGFAICVAHTARHANQIERTIARLRGAA
jgi:hypothetical protein